MSDLDTLFDLLLSPERSTAERLQSLNSLRPFLENEQAVNRLADAAREEASVELRAAMLRLLCDVDITRISRRDALIESLGYFVAMEPERGLRRIAVEHIATIGMHDERIQQLLAETMQYDLDPLVQQVCINGLCRCVQKTPATIGSIQQYLPQAPAECYPALLVLVEQLPQNDVLQLMPYFLDARNAMAVRMDAIHILSAFPGLSTAIVGLLLQQLQREPQVQVRTAIVNLLSGLRELDITAFRLMLDALQQSPDQPELLQLAAGRLTAHPEWEQELSVLFEQTSSASLKIQLLHLLQHSGGAALWVMALQDVHVSVRATAVSALTAVFPRYPDILEPALTEAIHKEKLVALRKQMLAVLLQTGRKSAETEQFLLSWAVQETDPSLKMYLVQPLLQLPVTGSNRKALLPLYQQVLEAVYFPAALKQQVAHRVQAFAYLDEPGLKQCLLTLLQNATDIAEIQTLYQRIKTLEPDAQQLAPVLLDVLYKHIAWYPQSPLDEWVQLLGKLATADAALRSQFPHLISITGATWLLTEADKADQTGAFLPAFRQTLLRKNGTQHIEASRLLREAWENRTLKKAEVIELYKMLLSVPKTDGLLQQLVDIMQTGKLVTSELVQLSLDYLCIATDAEGAYAVRKYLERTAQEEAAYHSRLLQLFTQENYLAYYRLHAPGLHNKRKFTNKNEWEYAGWYGAYNRWPIAELYFAREADEVAFLLLAQAPPPDLDPTLTLQYLMLEQLWRDDRCTWCRHINSSAANLEKLLDALLRCYFQLDREHALADRAMLLFWKKWPEYNRLLNGNTAPAHLAEAAERIYLDVAKLQAALDSRKTG